MVAAAELGRLRLLHDRYKRKQRDHGSGRACDGNDAHHLSTRRGLQGLAGSRGRSSLPTNSCRRAV